MCRMALGNDFFVFYMFSVFLKAEVNGDQISYLHGGYLVYGTVYLSKNNLISQ